MMKHTQLPTHQPQPKQPDLAQAHGKQTGVVRLVLTLIFAGLVIFAFLERQWFVDQYVFMTFKPSSDVVALASRAGLNDQGKFYLYTSRPEIDDRAAFNESCGKLANEKTVVLGCYLGLDKRIYIFKVTDTSLDGVEDVTAAHEMLHAAYDRLSPGEKDRVNKLLLEQQKTITDTRLIALIKEYEQTEPKEVVNELHSIFGTEVRQLSPELEQYYSRYFSDRSAVVTLKERYEKVFADLALKQADLVKTLNSMAQDVNTRQTAYETALAALDADIASFNTWAQSGKASKSDYNTRRAALEVRIAALNIERDAINAVISSYNAKKAELDQLNVQAESLNQSINSKQLQSTPSL